MTPEFTRPLSLCISAAVILLFILLFAGSAGKPLNLDNMDFPAIAQHTAFTGMPTYYKGEEEPNANGLYHPPLYIYLLAGWVRAFGFGEAQVRLFGMICALLQGAIVLAIIRTLFGPDYRRIPIFWAAFLLNPYTLQAASIADIDSTTYGPLLCLAVLLTLRISWRDGEWRTDSVSRVELALIGAAMFLCLWAKLTTVLLLFPFVFLLLIARMGVCRAALSTAVISGVSILAFLASYYLYGALTGMDVGFTFRFTLMSFLIRGSSGDPGLPAMIRDRVKNFRDMIPFTILWTGFLPWAAACVAVWAGCAAASRRRDHRLVHYGLVLALALLTTAYYCAQTTTFGLAPFKYVFVYWGLVAAAPVVLLEWAWPHARQTVNWTMAALLVCLVLAVAVWANLRVRDMPMMNGLIGSYWPVIYVPALLFLAALAAARYWRATLAFSMAAFALYSGIEFGIAVYQEKAPYATTYNYGQSGMLDTLAFLTSNTSPNDVIAAMKDIGFRCRLRWFETYGVVNGSPGNPSELHFKQEAESGRFAYVVFTEVRGQDELVRNPQLQRWFLERFALVRSFGHYRVYQIKSRAGEASRSLMPRPGADPGAGRHVGGGGAGEEVNASCCKPS